MLCGPILTGCYFFKGYCQAHDSLRPTYLPIKVGQSSLTLNSKRVAQENLVFGNTSLFFCGAIINDDISVSLVLGEKKRTPLASR